jgi:type VI secretion system secreted protein VgrG
MPEPKYNDAGDSSTSPVEYDVRKVIKVKPGPVCWIDDYDKEIIALRRGQYYLRYNADGTPNDNTEDNVKYKLYLPSKSEKNVVIEVRFRVRPMVDPIAELVESSDIATTVEKNNRTNRAATIERVKAACIRSIEAHWNNKFKLKITDPVCGTKTLPIVYKVIWVASGEHYIFRIYGRIEREQVSDGEIYVATSTDDHTHAHEFAHCVGVTDEYSYADDKDQQVRYYKPDGTLGPIIVVKPEAREVTDPLANIMNSDSTKIEIHHGWHVAIEAQALLCKKIGRNITCEVLLA